LSDNKHIFLKPESTDGKFILLQFNNNNNL